MGEERHMNGAIRRALAGQSRMDVGPCPDLNLVTAYLEGSLSQPERTGIEAHAAICPSCQELLALSMKLADEDLPLEEGVAAVSPRRKVLFRFSIPISALAAVLLTAGLALFLMWHQRSEKPVSTEMAELRAREVPAPPGSGAESPAKAPAIVAAPEYAREAEMPTRSPTEAAAGEAADSRTPEANALREVTAAPPEPEQKVAGGLVGGVVGGIMPPAPAEESRMRTVEPLSAQVAARSEREGAESIGMTKDEIATGKPKASRESPGVTEISGTVSQSPREVIQGLATALQEEDGIDKARLESYRTTNEAAGRAVTWKSAGRRLVSGRAFELYSGYWIDVECTRHADGVLAELPARAPEAEEIRKAMPDLEKLLQSGRPLILHWKGKNIVLR